MNFCLKTLYNYIFNSLFLNFKTNHLPYYCKKRKYRKISKSIRKIGGRSIEERAENINNRDELGHGEMDTVVGKRGTKAYLLVLTERKSRQQIIEKLEAKDSQSMIKGVKKYLKDILKAIKIDF